MATSAITPAGSTYLGQSKYTVTDSDRATIEASLTITVSTPVTFTLTYPLAAAPTGEIVQGAGSVALATTAGTIVNGNRRVTIDVTPDGGGNDVMTVVVETTSGSATNEPWTIRIRTLTGHQCAFEVVDGTLALTRMLADAHAAMLLPGTVNEGDILSLSSGPALVKGVDPVNAAVKVNYIGPVPSTSDPKTRYRWTYTGPATLTDLPDVTTTAGKNVNIPASVFELNPTIQVSLQAWLTDDATPPTPASVPGTNDLPVSGGTLAVEITHRPQRFMVVLDRTGSMSGPKWDHATTAARMMSHLFTAIRSDTQDKVGILVFDDGACTWHNDPVSATTVDAMALTDPGTAEPLICTESLGSPGACTNIGDALDTAWKQLGSGAPAQTRYAAVLITDGIENAGHRKIDPTTDTGGVSVLTYSVPPQLNLSTIGVGSDVNNGALNAIAGDHVFHALPTVTDIVTLKSAATMSVAQLFNANALTVTSSPSVGDTSPAVNARYFVVNAGEHRMAFAVELTDPSDTVEIKVAVNEGTTFSDPADPTAVKVRACSTYQFVVVDLDKLFGGGAVQQTEWRIVLKHAGSNVAGVEKLLVAWADLRAKADHVFDKQYYRTGEPVQITVRLRDRDQPISGARVSVTMKRPRVSLGDFLARNYGLVVGASGTIQTHGDKRGHAGDASAKSMLFEGILAAKGEADLGWEEPPGIFADGTNDLHEEPGTGNYSNVYTQTTKEGAISFGFYVDGTLADGSTFSRYVAASKWIGVKVDPLVSDLNVVYGLSAPAGYQAVQVTYRPQDRFGNLLGPFRGSELSFVATAGTWDGDVVSDLDGTYRRTLLYRKEDGVPVVTVETQGTSTVPIPIVKGGCLGFLLGPLLWLLRLVARLIERAG